MPDQVPPRNNSASTTPLTPAMADALLRTASLVLEAKGILRILTARSAPRHFTRTEDVQQFRG